MKVVYRFLILFGIACYVFGIYLIWERNNSNRLTFKSYVGNYRNVKIDNPPTRIIIRDLNIDLPIFPATIKNNQWEATTQGASYLLSSSIPGELGNSIIYAHDWASLFGPLLNARQGDEIEIEFADKTRKSFVVEVTKVVSNTESSILKDFGDKRLTLYTCTGFLDSQRFVVVAKDMS